MPKVLLVGNDSRLLDTRAAIMARAGASTSCGDPAEAERLLEADQFDLIVFCHSVPEWQVDQISQLAQERSPEVRFLLVVADAGHDGFGNGSGGDEHITINSFEPEHLLKRTMQLLQSSPFAERKDDSAADRRSSAIRPE